MKINPSISLNFLPLILLQFGLLYPFPWFSCYSLIFLGLVSFIAAPRMQQSSDYLKSKNFFIFRGMDLSDIKQPDQMGEERYMDLMMAEAKMKRMLLVLMSVVSYVVSFFFLFKSPTVTQTLMVLVQPLFIQIILINASQKNHLRLCRLLNLLGLLMGHFVFKVYHPGLIIFLILIHFLLLIDPHKFSREQFKELAQSIILIILFILLLTPITFDPKKIGDFLWAKLTKMESLPSHKMHKKLEQNNQSIKNKMAIDSQKIFKQTEELLKLMDLLPKDLKIHFGKDSKHLEDDAQSLKQKVASIQSFDPEELQALVNDLKKLETKTEQLRLQTLKIKNLNLKINGSQKSFEKMATGTFNLKLNQQYNSLIDLAQQSNELPQLTAEDQKKYLESLNQMTKEVEQSLKASPLEGVESRHLQHAHEQIDRIKTEIAKNKKNLMQQEYQENLKNQHAIHKNQEKTLTQQKAETPTPSDPLNELAKKGEFSLDDSQWNNEIAEQKKLKNEIQKKADRWLTLKKLFEKYVKHLVFLLIAGLAIYYYQMWSRSPKDYPIQSVEAPDLDKNLLAREILRIQKMNLAPKEEIIACYNIILPLFKAWFGPEELPPGDMILQKLSRDREMRLSIEKPFFAVNEVFVQGFYGEKEISTSAVKLFRRGLTEVLRFFLSK